MRANSASYPVIKNPPDFAAFCPLRPPGRRGRNLWAGGSVTALPRLGQIGEVGQGILVVLQRVGRGFRLDRRAVPQRGVVEQIDMVSLAVERGAHVQKGRQEPGRDLVLEPAP